MRMTRARDDESGAVLVFVAVCLVVLLGMVALTVDLGRAVAIKRDMVNAADAAALAGAQVCAIHRDAGLAEADALETSSLNGADGTFSFSAPQCEVTNAPGGARTVTVTSRTFVEYLIAPILGFEGTDVVASATAIWQPTGVKNPVPFVAAEGTFASDCPIGPDLPVGTPCYLWFDNDDFEGSTFGTLNLNAWNVSETEDCANKEMGANEHYAAIGGYDGPELPPLNEEGPTWVCAATGNAQPMYTALAQAIGKIIALPVTRLPCVRQGSHCEVFNVIAFARMVLTGVYKQNEAPAECGTRPENASSHCITVEWAGYGRGTEDPIPSGSDFGFFDIRLVR
jgi:Flp pilus assembly protein TadG